MYLADDEAPAGQTGAEGAQALRPVAGETPGAATVKPVAASALALAAAACGGGGDGGGTGGTGGGGPPVATARKPQTDAEAARFLLQASLSASPGAIAELRSEGFEPWLDRQMRTANDQTGAGFLSARGFDQVTAARFFDGTITGDYMIWSQLLSGGNPVRKRIAFALSEFFVVSLTGIDMVWRAPAIAAYWDTLNARAFGNFRDLLQDITLNPAMGVFLNTRGNRRADGSGRVPDENYAREVMQLFTIGLFELNADGTLRMNGGNPVETYTSADVSNLARVFTGYDFDRAGLAFTTEIGGPRQIIDPE
ncbi:DUF1800 family protein, partial [Erythrobacter donghaensis]